MLRHLAVALATLLISASAWAESPKSKIAEFNTKAAEYEQRDVRRAAAREIGTLREWLGEASALLKADEEEGVADALQRVRVQARLIEALLDRDSADDAARRALSEADAREKAADEMTAAAQALEVKLAELEQVAKPAGGNP